MAARSKEGTWPLENLAEAKREWQSCLNADIAQDTLAAYEVPKAQVDLEANA